MPLDDVLEVQRSADRRVEQHALQRTAFGPETTGAPMTACLPFLSWTKRPSAAWCGLPPAVP